MPLTNTHAVAVEGVGYDPITWATGGLVLLEQLVEAGYIPLELKADLKTAMYFRIDSGVEREIRTSLEGSCETLTCALTFRVGVTPEEE